MLCTGSCLHFPLLLHCNGEPAAGPAAQHRLHGPDRDVSFGQQLFQNIQHTLPGTFAVGGVGRLSPQHLRADAFGITHLIEAPGLENLGKKALRVPVFSVLGAWTGRTVSRTHRTAFSL